MITWLSKVIMAKTQKPRIFKKNWQYSEGSSPPLAITFKSAESLDFTGFPLSFCPEVAPIGDTSERILLDTSRFSSVSLH